MVGNGSIGQNRSLQLRDSPESARLVVKLF
jgi:hypothetical protein